MQFYEIKFAKSPHAHATSVAITTKL